MTGAATESEVSAVLRRIDRLECRAAIGDLLVRYALLLDDHEFDEVGDLFTEDAVFGSPGGEYVGRSAIVEHYRLRGGQYPVSLHVPRAVLVELDDADPPQRATGRVMGYSEQAGAHGSVAAAFRYDDVYARGADGWWRFARRTVLTVYALPHEQLAAGAMARPLRDRWPHRPPRPAQLPPEAAVP